MYSQFHSEWRASREEWLSNYSNAGTIRKYRPYVNKLIQYVHKQGIAQQHPEAKDHQNTHQQLSKDVKSNETPSNQNHDTSQRSVQLS